MRKRKFVFRSLISLCARRSGMGRAVTQEELRGRAGGGRSCLNVLKRLNIILCLLFRLFLNIFRYSFPLNLLIIFSVVDKICFSRRLPGFFMWEKSSRRIIPKNKTRKRLFSRFSFFFPTKIFWAFTNICQRRARKEWGDNLTPNKQSKQTCNAMFARAKQNFEANGGKMWLENEQPNRFRLSVIWDKQSRLASFIFLLSFLKNSFLSYHDWNHL